MAKIARKHGILRSSPVPERSVSISRKFLLQVLFIRLDRVIHMKVLTLRLPDDIEKKIRIKAYK